LEAVDMLVLQSITFSGATSEYCQSFISGFAPRFSFSGNLSLFRDKQVFPEDLELGEKNQIIAKKKESSTEAGCIQRLFSKFCTSFCLVKRKKKVQ